jgi:hypothetical protein
VASPSGLEPLTYALEERCSIQLSYGDMWPRRDSNPQPIGYEPTALTIELQGLTKMVQGAGIEPALGPHLGHTRYKLVGTSSYTNLAKSGAQGGTRTHTVVRPTDFKSVAAAITPPEHFNHEVILDSFDSTVNYNLIKFKFNKLRR